MATEDPEPVGRWKGRRVYKVDGKHLVEMSEELVELFKAKQNQEVENG